MSFDNINFISEPKLKFKEYIAENVECIISSFQYDCYKDKNGEVILIISHNNSENPGSQYHILLKSLNSNKVIKELEGHKEAFLTVRYFQNPYSKKDYLISASKNNAIVWDLNDFSKIFEKNNSYDSFFYSNLLIFDLNKIYAVISTIGEGSTKVFDLKDQSKCIDLSNTDNFSIFYLDYWYNIKSNQYIIIQCGKKFILMTEFPNNKTFDSFNSIERCSYNLGALVFRSGDRDLLAISSSNGLIIIYDLEQKKIMLKIIFNKVDIGNFIKWNDNYLFILDSLNEKLIIFNIKNNEFKQENEISLPDTKLNKFIKKVNHPIYGESIMSLDISSKIRLFVNAEDK